MTCFHYFPFSMLRPRRERERTGTWASLSGGLAVFILRARGPGPVHPSRSRDVSHRRDMGDFINSHLAEHSPRGWARDQPYRDRNPNADLCPRREQASQTAENNCRNRVAPGGVVRDAGRAGSSPSPSHHGGCWSPPFTTADSSGRNKKRDPRRGGGMVGTSEGGYCGGAIESNRIDLSQICEGRNPDLTSHPGTAPLAVG
jgi:hypothetical protein